MLTSSVDPLNMKRSFTLRFIAYSVPLVSCLLKFYLSSRSLPLLQVTPFASIWGYFSLIVVEGYDTEGALLILP